MKRRRVILWKIGTRIGLRHGRCVDMGLPNDRKNMWILINETYVVQEERIYH